MNPYQTHKTRSPWNPVRLTRLIDANLHDQPPPSPLRPVPT